MTVLRVCSDAFERRSPQRRRVDPTEVSHAGMHPRSVSKFLSNELALKEFIYSYICRN